MRQNGALEKSVACPRSRSPSILASQRRALTIDFFNANIFILDAWIVAGWLRQISTFCFFG
jgi:hypothetical protein